MDDKVIGFRRDAETYRKLAEERNEAGDFTGAIGFLFEAKKLEPESFDVLMDIADTYADMNLLELSNQYWYYFLDKAPEDKYGIAYVELAINYFYMKKIWASGYYFHKKVSVDGYLSPDGIDPEITDYFAEMAGGKPEARIVYPSDKTDYESIISKADRAAAEEDYERAISLLESVPEDKRSEEVSGELAFMYFLCKKDDKLVEECRSSLNRHGENVTAYCNLSAYYADCKNIEKSFYYYSKALQCCKDKEKYAYKLATAAMDHADHVNVAEFTGIMTGKNRYDLPAYIMNGEALINLGRYEEAEDAFSHARRINPEDTVLQYYVNLSRRLQNGDKTAEKLLPLDYIDDLPAKEIALCKRAIKDYFTKNKLSAPRKAYIRDVVQYGADSADAMMVKGSFLFGASEKGGVFSERDYEFVYSLLMKTGVPAEVKSNIITILVNNGNRRRFGVVSGIYYVKIKPRKLVFRDKENGAKFVAAYAECLTRLAFAGIDDEGKLGFAINKLYAERAEDVEKTGLNEREIAAVTFLTSGISGLLGAREACIMFEADYNSVAEFIKLGENIGFKMKGKSERRKKDDKNN